MKRVGLGLVLLAAGLLPAMAEERIERFVSDVAVERDGDLDVTETIRIRAEGVQIRHGILRDFPTRYVDKRGASVVVGFSVQSVSLDGTAEPYALESLANGERIRIGSADRSVTPGTHDYVIHYRTTRQIGYFSDFDELYWNATGTGWTFPIDLAEARITLPDPVPFKRSAVYTGPEGASGKDARVIQNEPGRIVFQTTAPLPRETGLTIAVAWQKGVVDAPSNSRQTAWWIEDNLGAIAALLSGFLGLAYFLLAWNKVGRDPPQGTMVPLFSPPDGISAAAARYIAEMDFDNRTFTAAILDLGVHRRLKLADNGNILVLSQQEGGNPINAPEAAVERTLFRSSPTLSLVQSNHATLAASQSALRSGLAKAYAGKVFHWNAGWLAIGILITVAAYALTLPALIVSMGSDAGVTLATGLLFASVGGVVIGIAISADGNSRSWFRRVGAWLVMSVLALGFIGVGLGVVASSMRGLLDALPLLLPLILLPILVSSFKWMRSPTAEGQTLRDAIRGFRQYLGVAEENRLEFLHPPEKTPELFERYLPYAVALDVENAWATKFADILASAGAGAAVAHWYLASSNRNATELVDRLGSNLSRTVASASTAPGSSSGSSGGGSSGGGGGGGGGSGW